MELSSTKFDNDTLQVVDSGTESYTESPVAEDEYEHPEPPKLCDIEIQFLPEPEEFKSKNNSKHTLHILDKAVSVDEDTLDTPLEPTKALNSSIFGPQEDIPEVIESDIEDVVLRHPEKNDSLEVTENETSLTSILRRESSCFEERSNSSSEAFNCSSHRVSFPDDYTCLVSYKEPEDEYHSLCAKLPPEKILKIYQNSCKHHNTIELDLIKQQIQDIKNNLDHSATLNLTSLNITAEVNETFEDLFKVTNFRTMVLNECKFTSETISEFFNMLVYYDSVCELEISCPIDDFESWKTVCQACGNMLLESLSFKGMTIYDQYTCALMKAIRNNPRITILKFDSCALMKLPSFYLVESLMSNTTIQELYLPYTRLYTKEAECLGRFLQKNFHLKVLDISNNYIGDRGLEVLAKGLIKQNDTGIGLSVFVIFNNQITEKSGQVINNIIKECKNLHTLNVGYNNLTDDVIQEISESLAQNTCLEGLGLQCTLLTCKGMTYLAQAIEKNLSLQKINLKGNKAIQVTGLNVLCSSLTNSKIAKIEIDEVNRSCNDPDAYSQMVKKINAICTVNRTYMESNKDEIVDISQMISRKISLSCEPRFVNPHLLPSVTVATPTSSSYTSISSNTVKKSRFQITKVNETITSTNSTAKKPRSRFQVTKVVSLPEENQNLVGKFANVRSSVSITDSAESLTVQNELSLDSDSE